MNAATTSQNPIDRLFAELMRRKERGCGCTECEQRNLLAAIKAANVEVKDKETDQA